MLGYMASTSPLPGPASGRPGRRTHADRSLLPRPRLVERVLSTPPAGLCLVEAPPGYGGTTLLATAVERVSRAAWVSLDAADSPASFTARLLTALGAPTRVTSDGAVGQAQLLLDALSRTGPLFVVIADLDPATHAALLPVLQDLVDLLPAHVRLALRTRPGNTLELARITRQGRLVLIGAADLRLTPDEAGDFLTMAAPTIPAPRRTELVTAAHGWWAALSAAVVAAGSQPLDDPVAWLLGPGLELLFGDEVDRLAPADRDLLITTSVLDVLTAAACDAITSRNDSADALARLSRAGLLERDRLAHRVAHPLLSELLRRRLGQRPQAERDAHLAAARWYAATGDFEATITQQFRAGDVVEALGLLRNQLPALLDGGHAEAVRAWYDNTLQTDLVDEQAHLLGAAWADLMAGDLAGAQPRVYRLLDIVASLPPEPASVAASPVLGSSRWLRAETELIAAYVDGWTGGIAGMRARLVQARAHFGSDWDRMAPQVAAFLQVRSHLWTGDIVGGRELLLEVITRTGTKEYLRQVFVPALRALLAAQDGRARQATSQAAEALAWIAAAGRVSKLDECDALLARGLALIDLDDAVAAAADAVRVRELAGAAGHVSWSVLAHVTLARATAAGADLRRTETALQDARALLAARAPQSQLRAVVDLAEAEALFELGKLDRAERAARRVPDGSVRAVLSARLHVARHGARAAESLPEIRPASRRGVLQLQVLKVAALARTRPVEAEARLLNVAETAHGLGLLRILTAAPAEVFSVAERVAAHHDSSAASVLLRATGQPTGGGHGVPPIRLSPGEGELLELLSRGGSTVDAAAALGVSVNTVKTRLRRLYAKLGVHDREAALKAAARLP